MAQKTATAETIAHYLQPDIKEAILKYCHDGKGKAWRPLNGDSGWYTGGAERGTVRLTGPADYDYLVKKYRSLYATLDFLDSKIRGLSVRYDKERSRPVEPIGTLQYCQAFTPSVDIDSIGDIHEPDIKEAVERAGQYFCDYLKQKGISKSVHCLYSGGGLYVHVHHKLWTAPSDWSGEQREQAYRSLSMAFNSLITEIEAAFFSDYPEFEGKVKFDKLNNQKRKFKCLFSIHKKYPYAVVPLDPGNIIIDFQRAKLPLSAEVIEAGTAWYQEFDPEDKDRLKERKARSGDYEISRRASPISQEEFPPCVQNIISDCKAGKGPHRALAVLAAFLYQVGWSAEDAFKLWSEIGGRSGVEDRIFDQWYGVMSCPSCSTIQRNSAGYPAVGLGGLGYCEADNCDGRKWPGDLGKKDGRGLDIALSEIAHTITINKGKENERVEHKFSPTKAAQVVLDNLLLAMSARSKDIWHYSAGIFKPDGVRVIDTLLCEIGKDLITHRNLAETVRRATNCLRGAPVTFDANPYLFPTQDGVLDLQNGAFRDARPEDSLTFKYASAYNAKPDFMPFLWFLCTCLPDKRDVLTVLDLITATAIRVPFDVFTLWLGGGSNGKGILERVMLALFTSQRSTAITLKEMKQSRFGPGALLDKDLWIVTEVETVKDATDVLKKVATGELLDTDVKYGDRMQGRPHLLPILDANKAIDFKDDSRGLKRRFIKLDFPYSFGILEGDRPEDTHMEDKLTTPEVLAGITQIIAARAPDLIESKRIYSRKRLDEIAGEYKRQLYHLNYFCDECLGVMDTAHPGYTDLKVEDAYAEYLNYCALYNVPTPADRAPFGKYLAERFSVTSYVSNSVRYYPGLQIKAKAITVFAENKIEYGYCTQNNEEFGSDWLKYGKVRISTGEVQENSPITTNSRDIQYRSTGDLLKQLLQKIIEMYEYINSHDILEISFKQYMFWQFSCTAVLNWQDDSDSVKNLLYSPVLSCTDSIWDEPDNSRYICIKCGESFPEVRLTPRGDVWICSACQDTEIQAREKTPTRATATEIETAVQAALESSGGVQPHIIADTLHCPISAVDKICDELDLVHGSDEAGRYILMTKENRHPQFCIKCGKSFPSSYASTHYRGRVCSPCIVQEQDKQCMTPIEFNERCLGLYASWLCDEPEGPDDISSALIDWISDREHAKAPIIFQDTHNKIVVEGLPPKLQPYVMELPDVLRVWGWIERISSNVSETGISRTGWMPLSSWQRYDKMAAQRAGKTMYSYEFARSDPNADTQPQKVIV